MPGFNASKAVEKLDWDFTEFAGPDAKGTIPEPSEGALTTFQERLKALYGEDFDPTDAQALRERFKDVDEGEILTELLDAVAELCSETPTAEQIRALPPRVRTAFMGWLLGSITDPTNARSAMRR